jgi:hypothetical protein
MGEHPYIKIPHGCFHKAEVVATGHVIESTTLLLNWHSQVRPRGSQKFLCTPGKRGRVSEWAWQVSRNLRSRKKAT